MFAGSKSPNTKDPVLACASIVARTSGPTVATVEPRPENETRMPFLLPLLLLFLALPTAASPPHELGARRDPNEMGAGGLLFQTQDGFREAPLLATDVEIRVAGLIARTHVTQRFTNPTENWVAGVYVFPLPEGSAVDSLRMRIGDRLIKGQVAERARARSAYHRARAEGRKARI